MAVLTHHDVKDVLIVTHKALESKTIDEMRNQVLDCLEIIFKADKSAFIIADSFGSSFDYQEGMVYRGFEPSFNIRYAPFRTPPPMHAGSFSSHDRAKAHLMVPYLASVLFNDLCTFLCVW